MGAYSDEQLRKELLDEIYAGAFSGIPGMLTEEDEIKNANSEELQRIAHQHGY